MAQLPTKLTQVAIASIADTLGIEFKVIDDRALATDDSILYLLTKVPDLTGMYGTKSGGFDAILIYQCTDLPISWSQSTRASITKWLKDPTNKDCIVCLEEAPYGCSITCLKCKGRVCMVCLFKSALTEEVGISLNFGPNIPWKCAQCRIEGRMDVRNLYCSVLDRLDEFPEQQQEILLDIKDRDGDGYAYRMSLHKDRVALKVGSFVKLKGLKKQEWNGKTAIIIGEKSIKKGVTRYPIAIKNDLETKALIKSSNLKKIGQS